MSEPQPSPAVPKSSRGGRSVAAVICVVLAALLTVPAGFAYWGQRTLTDAQRYVDTVGPLVNSPQVRAAISTKVTDAIEQQVDVEAILNRVFAGVITDRPRLQALVGPVAGAVNGLIEKEVANFVDSQAFADLWVTLNTRAQQRLVQLLEGNDSGALSLQGDQVVLDVTDVINQVKQRLVDRGLTIVQRVPIPDKDRQIVLMTAPELKQARTIYAFSNPIAKWLIVLVVLLFIAAMVLARRRPRMAVVIGLALAANALLLALLLSVGRQLFVNELAGSVFGPASRVFYDQLLVYLRRGDKVLFWLGVIIVFAGWFAGTNRSGTAARTSTGGTLENVGASLSDTPVAGAGQWVAGNAMWLRWAAAVLGVVVLVWGNDISPSRMIWSLVLVLVLLVVIQVLVGTGRSASAPPVGPVDPPADGPGDGPDDGPGGGTDVLTSTRAPRV